MATASGSAVFHSESSVGEVLRRRALQLQGLKGGLGPCDVCHLVWTVPGKGQGLLSRSTTTTHYSEYHSFCGVDASQPASIAAYFSQVLEQRKPSTASKFTKGTVAVYNAFSGDDLRVEITSGSSPPQVYTVHKNGRMGVASEGCWHHASVSSTLRAMRIARGLFWQRGDHPDCVFREPFETAEEESLFLRRAKRVFWDAHRLNPLATSCVNDLVEELCLRFEGQQRIAAGTLFFGQFVAFDPCVAAVVSRLLRMHKQTSSVEEHALLLLARALLRNQLQSSPLTLEQSHWLQNTGNLEAAVAMGQLAVDLSPGSSAAWVQLTRAYAANGQHDLALCALNSIHLDLGSLKLPAPMKASSVKQPGSEGKAGEAEPPASHAILADLPGTRLTSQALRVYEVFLKHQPATHETLMRQQNYPASLYADKIRPTPSEAEQTSTMQKEAAESAAASGDAVVTVHRRRCRPWLDKLMTVLHLDLVAYAVCESAEGGGAAARGKSEHYRFAALASRLGDCLRARRSYEATLELTPPGSRLHLRVLCELLRLTVAAKETTAAVCYFRDLAHSLASWKDDDPSGALLRTVKGQARSMMYRLVSQCGVRMVGEVFGQLEDKDDSGFCLGLLQEAVIWQVEGHQR